MRNPGRQRGVTVVVVLVLLSAMLMGGLALARLSEVGTLAAGNVASKEGAMQATELGTARAFQVLHAVGFNPNVDQGNWYYAKIKKADDHGVPIVSWDSVPKLSVGRYSVRTVIERMCTTDVVNDPLQECLVKEEYLGDQVVSNCGTANDCLEGAHLVQFRATVQATDEKGARILVQTMIN